MGRLCSLKVLEGLLGQVLMLTNGTAGGAHQKGHKQSSLEDEAIGGVGFEKGRKHKRLHRHQLDQDVQGRARGVFQWLQQSSMHLPERVYLM